MKEVKKNNQKPHTSESLRGGTAVKRKKKMTTPAKILIGFIAVLLVGIICLSFLVFRKYSRIQSAQNQANQLYTPSSEETDIMDDTPAEVDPETGVVSDFNPLYEKNNETVGHISIPGTKLSTPIVQGTDNVYYLNHNFFRESSLGVPFVDSRATIKQDYMSTNITIYGHAAKDGSYFAPIKDYRTVDFYKKNPIVNFDTIYGKGKYKIIGAFIAKVKNTASTTDDPEEFNYQDYIDMSSEEQFNAYIAEVTKRSYFKTGVDVEYGDQLLTLSTCDDQIDSSDKTPYRMVVVARKVRGGESINVDVSGATANTDMIMPKAWQEKYKKANPYK